MTTTRVALTMCLLVLASMACGGNEGAAPARSYSLALTVDDSMERYRYVAEASVDIRVGDEVTFEMNNTGTLIHDLVVLEPDGDTIAEGEPVAPGADLAITVRFDEPGFYRLQCLVDDHLTVHEMQQIVEVTAADGA